MSASHRRAAQAVRHHGPAVRERPVPHRPHHGVHPGRHLGALPADAGPRGALRLRRRRARRADHAARPKPRASRRRSSSREIAATRAEAPRGFHISFDSLALDRFAGEHRAVAGHLPQAARRGPSLIDTKPVEQFFDPVKGMFLPDRYIKGECPKCGAKDQYGDACEICGSVYAPTDLKNPYSTLSGATPELRSFGPFLLPAVGPALRRVPASAGRQDGARCSPRSPTRRASGSASDGDKGLADWDISRDAPYFGIPIPDAPGKYFYVWLDAPVGYLASLKAHFAQARHRLRTHVPARIADRRRAGSLHRQGHHLLPHAVLAGDAAIRRRAVQGAGQRVRARLHHVVRREDVEVARHRHQPATSTSTSASNPEWLRYYIAAKLNARVEDIDFNPDDFIARVNSDLDRQVRQHREPRGEFITRHFDGELRTPADDAARADGSARSTQAAERGRASDYERARVRQGDARCDAHRRSHQPGASTRRSRGLLAKDPARRERAAGRLLATRCTAFELLTVCLAPVLPAIADARRARTVRPRPRFRLERRRRRPPRDRSVPAPDDAHRSEAGRCAARRAAGASPPPLRAAASCCTARRRRQRATAATISIDDFAKIDLRIAQIVNAEHVDGADKLLKLTLDVGEGRAAHRVRRHQVGVRPEDLIGRLTPMVANLAPRKMKFGVSEGMVLAASGDGPGIFLLAPDAGAQPGMRVK